MPAVFTPAIRRVHESLTVPVLSNGRPTFTPTNVVGPVWADYLRVTISGKDVTFWRGTSTIIDGWQHTDPYGWATSSLLLPQVTEFDDLDSATFAWLALGAAVRIERVLNRARVIEDDPPFVGHVTSLEPSSGGLQVGLTGLATTRLSAMLHQPAVDFRAAADGGRRMWQQFRDARMELLPNLGPETGVMVPSNGSRDMTRLGFCDTILGLLIGPNGGSWTVLPELSSGPRAFRMKIRSMSTTHATVYAGAHGVKVDGLGRDLFDNPTHIFGEGVSTTGERWRNAVYPDLGPLVLPPYPFTNGRAFGKGTTDAQTDTGDGITVLSKEFAMQGLMPAGIFVASTYNDDMVDAAQETQDRLGRAETGIMTPSLWNAVYRTGFSEKSFAGSRFLPLARDSRADRYLTTADGTIVGLNPDYDHTIIPVHQFVSYGEQVTKRQARANAKALRARGGERNGTVTLTSDPAELSRFDLKGGMTIRVRNLAGTAGTGLKLYISSVQVDWGSGSVTLAVSTSAKHFLELAAIRDRNAAAKADPAKRWRQQQRASQQVQDGMTGWEGESGAGIIRPTALQGDQWNVIPVVAARVGTIGELRLDTSGDTPFMCAMFADKLSVAELNGRLGNPFAWVGTGDNRRNTFEAHSYWLTTSALMIEAWGEPGQPCGYWPHARTNSNGKLTTWPATGAFRDNATWEFATQQGFLWLAVYPTADCRIEGRARVAISDGG